VPLRGRNRGLLVAFFVLAAFSLILKGTLGPTALAPLPNGAASVESRLVMVLARQGFVTTMRHLKIQSPIVYARRGNCRLSVRNAFGGAATEAAYADDALGIGRIRYLYDGESFSSPPTLRIHFAVIESSVLHSVGFSRRLHVPLALAASPGCGSNAFGLEDMQVPA